MKAHLHNKKWPATYWLIALIAGSLLFKLFLLEPSRLFESHHIGAELAEHGTFRYYINGQWNYNYQFPVYPFLLYPFYALGAGAGGALLLNIILGAATTWLIYGIACALKSNKTIALLAAAAVAFHPFITYYQVKCVHPFSLDLFFAALLFHASLTLHPARWKHTILLGVIAGLCLLNRPTLIVFGVPILARAYAHTLHKPNWKQVIILAVIVLIPTSLWLLRNYQIYGELTLNSSMGQNLWIGIQESTQGTTQLPDGSTYYTLLSPQEHEYLADMNPVEDSRYFMQKYMHEITAHPALFFKMYGIKLKNFWFGRQDLGIDHQGLIPAWGPTAYRVYTFMLFIFSILIFHLQNAIWNSLFLSVLLLSLVQCVFYVEMRHRVLGDPFLILASLMVIHTSIERNRHVSRFER